MDNPNPWKPRPIEIDLPALWESIKDLWLSLKRGEITEAESYKMIED